MPLPLLHPRPAPPHFRPLILVVTKPFVRCANMRLICTTNKAYSPDLHVFELQCNWVVRSARRCPPSLPLFRVAFPPPPLCRRLCPFALDRFILSILFTLFSYSWRWIVRRMEKDGIGGESGKWMDRWIDSGAMVVNYRLSNLKVLETLAWLATIRDASRYSCVKRGKKWRPRGGRNEPLQNGEWCTRVQIDRRI